MYNICFLYNVRLNVICMLLSVINRIIKGHLLKLKKTGLFLLITVHIIALLIYLSLGKYSDTD